MMNWKIFFYCGLMLICTSCIKEVNVELRNEKPNLVVEGAVSNDSVPYEVKLTYSGQIESAIQFPDELYEKDALVLIKDDQGNSTQLVYTDKGIYKTVNADFVGIPGRSYIVDITLSDGKKYISIPEKIQPPVPIDSVNVRFINDFNISHPTYLRAFVNLTDPANDENYYKWEIFSYTRRQTLGVGCGFYCINYEYCYQKLNDNEMHILSDATINGNAVLNQGVGNSYIFGFGKHYFDISQVSINRGAYQFWRSYIEQTTRTGGILDPLPASIKGNVYNAADTDDFALGYFSARSIIHKKLVVLPWSLTQYLLDISASSFFHRVAVPCFDYYPNSLSYPPRPADQAPPPPGWENAENITVYW